jgi:hypothetical protein
MNLDIDVRFTDDKYNQLGRGHANITTDNAEHDLGTVHQLGLAAGPVVAGLVRHAQLEAVASLKQVEREKEEKEKEKEA